VFEHSDFEEKVKKGNGKGNFEEELG